MIEGVQFVGFCCLAAAVIAWCFWHAAPRLGLQIAQGSAPVNMVSSQGAWIGPYFMPAGNRIYQLDLDTDLTTPGSWVAATLDRRAPPNAFAGNLSATSAATFGASSAPRGHANSLFRLARPGWYYVRLSSSLEPADTPAQIHFSLRDSVLYPDYLLLFWIVVGLAGIVMLVAGFVPR